jgi:hypothetical protein
MTHLTLHLETKRVVVAAALVDKEGAKGYAIAHQARQWLGTVEAELRAQRAALLVYQEEFRTYRGKLELYEQSKQRCIKAEAMVLKLAREKRVALA